MYKSKEEKIIKNYFKRLKSTQNNKKENDRKELQKEYNKLGITYQKIKAYQ